MADVYDGPFGAYTDLTEIVSAAAQAEIAAEIAKLTALVPDISVAASQAHPDFDQIPPHTASKLRTEIAALAAAIAAAPTS